MAKLYIEKGKFVDYLCVSGNDDVLEIYIDGRKGDIGNDDDYKVVIDAFDRFSNDLDDEWYYVHDMFPFSDGLLKLKTKCIDALKNAITEVRNSILEERKPKLIKPSDKLSESEKRQITDLVDEYVYNVILNNINPNEFDYSTLPAVRDGLLQFGAWILKK